MERTFWKHAFALLIQKEKRMLQWAVVVGMGLTTTIFLALVALKYTAWVWPLVLFACAASIYAERRYSEDSKDRRAMMAAIFQYMNDQADLVMTQSMANLTMAEAMADMANDDFGLSLTGPGDDTVN